MNRKRLLAGLLLCCVLLGCGPRTAQKAPASRDFPTVEVPAMVSEAAEDRFAWVSAHFWDAFTRTEPVYASDSTLLNGVKKEDVEKQMGVFASLLHPLPLEQGVPAMRSFHARLDAFQQAHPDSPLYPELTELARRYFYDPNSPVRSEDLYRPLAEALSQSEWVPEDRRPTYAWEARMCALNAVGTPATDFSFIDSKGRRRTLYGIRADITLLIFGHPDCTACKELVATMEAYPQLLEHIQKRELCVVDVYIDEELDAWKQHVADYPQEWINGYDPDYRIRTELLYHVRAVPSLYLLDRDKTVLLKDATPEDVLNALL